MSIGVYAWMNAVNNKVYVGSSTNIEKRETVHESLLTANRHYNFLLQNSWNDYGGRKSFKFVVLELTTESQLLHREQYWIDRYGSSAPERGYNIQPNAHNPSGVKRRPETVERLRESRLGKSYGPLSEEHKRKIGAAHKGMKRSEETRRKISEGNKRRRLSEETRAKISLHNIGKHSKPLSEEHKRKIGAAHKGRKFGPLSKETRLKMRLARKKWLDQRKAEVHEST